LLRCQKKPLNTYLVEVDQEMHVFLLYQVN